MTKLWILSDVHAEHARGKREIVPFARPDGVDVAVLTGDIDHARESVQTARFLVGPDLPIVMVAGNHEHWGALQTVPRGIALMKEAARREGNVFVLDNETVEIDVRGEPVRFVGATLWVDFELFGNARAHAEIGRHNLPDFLEIISEDPSYFAVRPADMVRWFTASCAFIRAELKKKFDGRTVVVTHHCPSMRSVAERFKTNPMAPCFASGCDELLDLGADLWVHGHTHDSFDYMAGRTRVVCNPHGYFFSGKLENQAFNPSLVIDVGEAR